MNPVARVLIVSGVLLIVAGLLWQFGGALFARTLHLGHLPGDVAIERENYRFYFPLTSSILVSVVLSLILYVIRYFSK